MPAALQRERNTPKPNQTLTKISTKVPEPTHRTTPLPEKHTRRKGSFINRVSQQQGTCSAMAAAVGAQQNAPSVFADFCKENLEPKREGAFLPSQT